MQINEQVLESLPDGPDGGSIAHRLSQREEEENSVVEESSDDEDEQEDVMDPPDQQHMGPAQDGATGVSREERPFKESFLMLPTVENRDQEEALRDYLQEKLKNTRTRFDWPSHGTMLSDYNTPLLQAMLFPTLFPYGLGDCTKRDRRVDISMTDANKHLLNYCIFDPNEKRWRYPFAEDPRWSYWAYNTAERHRCNGQKSVFLAQSPEFAQMSIKDLKEIVNQGGERFGELLGKMNAYNANINGSNAYLYRSRKNLEALIDQEGMTSM
jgi:hypothetical protein